MSVRIGCGLSCLPDPRLGAIEASGAARRELDGRPADLVLVFASGMHLVAPEATLEGIYEALEPEVLVGCGAGGVLGCGHEVEEGTAVAVWAAWLGDGTALPFHAGVEEIDDGLAVSGVPDLEGAAAAILLPDPISFPTDQVLEAVAERAPGVPIIGGVASARTSEGEAALFLGDEVIESGGAVGVRLDGVEVLPCVSQGAAPFGPELTITSADGHIIHELAGRPALSKLREIIRELPLHQRAVLNDEGLLVGIVVDGGKPEYVQGDFLVRGLLGADPSEGSVAVGTPVAAGQVLRLHARDAGSADRDLREALSLHVEALGGDAPAGALVFTCNGRGRGLFGVADHDAEVVEEAFAGAPAAGFFAAGEIGPVGGAPFLHGFTATVAVFPR
ncbi:MAG TPA: FIST N-terminal domain-containing protein [Solirubrobacteraceae bacterium]